MASVKRDLADLEHKAVTEMTDPDQLGQEITASQFVILGLELEEMQ